MWCMCMLAVTAGAVAAAAADAVVEGVCLVLHCGTWPAALLLSILVVIQGHTRTCRHNVFQGLCG